MSPWLVMRRLQVQGGPAAFPLVTSQPGLPGPPPKQVMRRLQVQGRPGFPRQYSGALDCISQVGFIACFDGHFRFHLIASCPSTAPRWTATHRWEVWAVQFWYIQESENDSVPLGTMNPVLWSQMLRFWEGAACAEPPMPSFCNHNVGN